MTFVTLGHDQERELARLLHFYWREASKCQSAKAYLAGSVMAASALEAMLMLTVNAYDSEAVATGVAPTGKQKQIRPLLEWDLGQLVKVAKAAQWFPFSLDLEDDWSGRQAKIGDYAEAARLTRNLLHPGYYLREHSHRRVTERYLERQLSIVERCRDVLAERNHQSLLIHMETEEAP